MSCYFHRETKGHRSALLLVIASHENQDLSEKDSCLQGSTLNTLCHGHQAAFPTANLSETSVRAIFKSSQSPVCRYLLLDDGGLLFRHGRLKLLDLSSSGSINVFTEKLPQR